MAKEFASRTHFVHLRNVTKEMPPAPETGLGPAGCTFTESDHLGGDVDMYSIMLTMLQEKQRRKAEGWGVMSEIPFRPDHGHKMVDDMKLFLLCSFGVLQGLRQVDLSLDGAKECASCASSTYISR